MTTETTTTTSAATTPVAEKKKGDPFIWGIYIALILISIVECFSASSQEISGSGFAMYKPILKHVMMLAVGFGLLYVIQKVDFKKFPRGIWLFMIITVVCMVIVATVGDYINGAKRSFTLPLVGVSVQPAEMAKLSIVTLIALFTARNQEVRGVNNRGVILSALFVLLYCSFTFMQGLTNTALLMGISFSMMLIGGVKWKKIFVVLICYAFAGGLFFIVKELNESKEETFRTEMAQANGEVVEEEKSGRDATWVMRVKRYFNSDSLVYQEMNSLNRQEMYSRIAQAHGGIVGVGLGGSRECSRLPLAFSDYIYSIIIEETGLVGGIIVLMLYLLLLARAGMIANKCSRAFPALLIMGVAVMITLQALFHMGINTGLFPVSGQPLPLISMGGTSIIIMSMAFGVMLSVSKYAVQNNKPKEIKAEGLALPEGLDAPNPMKLD